MADEKRTREVVVEALKEESLHNFIDIFGKEHNKFRGTHENLLAKSGALVQEEEPENPYAGLIWVDLSS